MAASAGSQHRCVFVGNIPYDATEEQLIQICEEVGPVVSFRLVLDRETGKPKGYGFCEYKDEETALSARRNLQGYEINGRQLRVDFAENDKGADRSKDQGRGGPGFTSNNDKSIPGPSILGDSSLHQPIGHPVAANAASSMARALGGTQSGRLPLVQAGSQNPSSLGNDPLTQHLAKMSRQQLNEIMSEMKALLVQNKPLAVQLLQGCPQLPKALFQAQIMLGMVTPQMMQMASTRHSSINPQPPIVPSYVGQTQVSSALPNPLTLQQSSVPLQLPVQTQFQPPLPQAQTHLQGTVPGKSGIIAQPTTFVSTLNQPQLPVLPTSRGLISQVQPHSLQHSSNPSAAHVVLHSQSLHPDSSLQQAYPHHLTSQIGSSNYPAGSNVNLLPNGAGTFASVDHDSVWAPRVSTHSISSVGLTAQIGKTSEDMIHHPPSKRPKLEDGVGAHCTMSNTLSALHSIPAQSVATGSVAGTQMANAGGLQHSESQTPQLAPEVESALLQQVMSLTPEKLSSLPREQQEQVLLLQQMLMKQNL